MIEWITRGTVCGFHKDHLGVIGGEDLVHNPHEASVIVSKLVEHGSRILHRYSKQCGF
jgi:hypothetical protein